MGLPPRRAKAKTSGPLFGYLIARMLDRRVLLQLQATRKVAGVFWRSTNCDIVTYIQLPAGSLIYPVAMQISFPYQVARAY